MEKIKWTDKAVAIGTILLFVATAILALYTYGLFKGAINQDDMAKKVFSRDSARFKQIDSLDNIKSEKQFNLQKSAVDEQIKSLKESQREFLSQNNSDLEVDEFKVYFDTFALKVFVFPIIRNEGNQTVKEIFYRGIVGAKKNENLDSVKRDLKFKKDKNYTYVVTTLNKNDAKPLGGGIPVKLSPHDFFAVRRGFDSIYVHYQIVYTNLTTGKNKIYEFYNALYQFREAGTINVPIGDSNWVIKQLPIPR